MSSQLSRHNRLASAATALVLAFSFVVLTTTSWAGHQFFRNNSVGGIAIDPQGFVRDADAASTKALLEELRNDIKPAEGAMAVPTGLRMVSLRGLNSAIKDAMQNNLGQLPESVQFLAGLQRIQYVLVYPDQNDIVLAGPGEGWKVKEDGNVVGITTGRPVLRLDNLITALRYVDQARQVGISCSIDPTEEGFQRANVLMNRARQSGGNVNLRTLEPALKQAFGPQNVSITGVPVDSHFARVMVAADYKMKRLAMNIDASPVRGMPSFLHMIRNATNIRPDVNPRWWLACDYEPLARSEDGLAWEIRGQGVKAMTETEVVNEQGQIAQTGKVDPRAQKWADIMTEKYTELTEKTAVFGELRNIMDMCVVAALIRKQGLFQKANCQVPMLVDADQSELEIAKWHAPKQIAPHCSFLRTNKGIIVTASGGIQIESWQTVNQERMDNAVKSIWSKGVEGNSSGEFWWN